MIKGVSAYVRECVRACVRRYVCVRACVGTCACVGREEKKGKWGNGVVRREAIEEIHMCAFKLVQINRWSYTNLIFFPSLTHVLVHSLLFFFDRSICSHVPRLVYAHV